MPDHRTKPANGEINRALVPKENLRGQHQACPGIALLIHGPTGAR